MAPTIFNESYNTLGVRRHEKITEWSLASDNPNFGLNNSRSVKFGPSRIDAEGIGGRSSRIGNDLQSR